MIGIPRLSRPTSPVRLHNSEQALVPPIFYPLKTARFRLFLRRFAMVFFMGFSVGATIVQNHEGHRPPSLAVPTKKQRPRLE